MTEYFQNKSVEFSSEFYRISKLPTREWTDEELEELASEMTKRLKTPEGTWSLRPKQAQALYEFGKQGGLVGMIRVGGGKCHGRGTPILMFDGNIKPVEEVIESDLLMGPDSMPRRVVSTCTGRELLYRVTPVKGDPYVVNANHVLTLKKTSEGYRFPSQAPKILDISVKDYLKLSAHKKANLKGLRSGVDFDRPDMVEPYFLGLWLGDGHSTSASITTADWCELGPEIEKTSQRFGTRIRIQHMPGNAASSYHLSSRTYLGGPGRNSALVWLRSLGVVSNKHIPLSYKAGNRHTRLEVLAGLIDSDGALAHSGFDFISKEEQLADDVCFLARSLGLAAYKKSCRKQCVNNGVWGTYHRVSISGDCSIVPCRLARKKAPSRTQKKDVLCTGIQLEEIGEGEYFGFQVEGPDARYLLGDFTVTHNSLISLLAPLMTNPPLRLPVLVVPASLVAKTEKDRQDLSKHFRIAKNLRIVSYEKLSRVDGATILETYRPDGLILDEAHRSKNMRAGVTKRLARYMAAHPETKVAAMSGTFVKKGLKDAGHIIRWALKDKAPVPSTQGELEMWADALDPGINPLRRLAPGPLLQWAEPEDQCEDDLDTARKAFRRRLISTPGVVSTAGDQVDCSLNISALYYEQKPETDALFNTLRSKYETPDGWAFSEAVLCTAYAKQLAIGFHYLLSPRPPQEWLDARRGWAKYVRGVLADSRSLDTELQVRMAVREGRLPEGIQTLDAWDKIKDTFVPNQIAQWHDDSALNACTEWMKQNKGLVWVEHTFFGLELSKRTGVPFFGAGGLTAKGESILDLESSKAAGKIPVILSRAANATGRNLQAWSSNLITCLQPLATELEQLLGRTHRDGQQADEVTVDILCGCWEHVNSMNRAKEQARTQEDMLGANQKLLLATIDFPDKVERRGERWQKQVAPQSMSDIISNHNKESNG